MLNKYERGYRDGVVKALQGTADAITNAIREINAAGELDGDPLPRKEVTEMLQTIARSCQEMVADVGTFK